MLEINTFGDIAEMSIEKELLSKFREKKLTFSAAESCTGGLIIKRLTDIPGCSDVILGGVCSYAVSVKEKVLEVPRSIIEAYGVVSKECALYMARGVKKITSSDIAVSVTGYAGPGGGDTDNPVGTVCFAAVSDKAEKTYRMQFGEALSREEIRDLSCDFALKIALDITE